MARLILKSPYFKSGAKACSHARYIATRERVELVPDGRPATKKQEQLIVELTKDFPDAKKLPEYGSYCDAPTKVNASAFITQALEDNWSDVQQGDIYAAYIATRPRVERVGSHGLFGDEDYVDLKKVTAELQACEKNVWTHIVSLKREDAARLGYDNAQTWRNLLRAHRNDIAAGMNIPPTRSEAYLRDPGVAERRGHQDRLQYAWPLRCRLHPAHLYPCHPPDAGPGGGNHGEFHEPNDVTPIRNHQKHRAGRPNFLPGALEPFPDISPCGSSCGSPCLTHLLAHIIFTQNRTKTPEIQRFQEFLGAATQI